MNGLKTFIVIDNATKYEYGGSDCSFFQDGVVCDFVDGEGNPNSIFIKKGEFTIKEIEVEVIQESYLFNNKVQEIYKKILWEHHITLHEEVEKILGLKDLMSTEFNKMNNFYNRKACEVNLRDASKENKKYVFAMDLFSAVYRFAYDQTDCSQFLIWLSEQPWEKIFSLMSNIDQVKIAMDAIQENYSIELNDLIEMGINQRKYEKARSEMYRAKEAELKEIAKEMAMKEV